MPVSNEIPEQFTNRVVAVFRLLQHLRTILQYLHAFDDVGIDADGVRSFVMAAEQRRLLSEEVGQAKECVCELDRSPIMLDIATALEMIGQTMEVGETLAGSAMDDGDEDRAIGHIKEAVCTSFEETASALNRLAASLVPKELIGRIDAETERLQCEYARLQHEQQAGNGAGPAEGQNGPERKPLGAVAAMIYEKLRSLPEHRGMDTGALLYWLNDREAAKAEGREPVAIDDGTLRGHLRQIEPYGLKNARRIGYYVR